MNPYTIISSENMLRYGYFFVLDDAFHISTVSVKRENVYLSK